MWLNLFKTVDRIVLTEVSRLGGMKSRTCEPFRRCSSRSLWRSIIPSHKSPAVVLSGTRCKVHLTPASLCTLSAASILTRTSRGTPWPLGGHHRKGVLLGALEVVLPMASVLQINLPVVSSANSSLVANHLLAGQFRRARLNQTRS